MTAGDEVRHVGNSPPMEQCNHKEADTRVLIHALQTSPLGMVRTGDTDVVVIILSNLHHIQALNTATETWISFKPWKTSTIVSLNYSASSRAVTMCKAMALCHAFTISSSKLN